MRRQLLALPLVLLALPAPGAGTALPEGLGGHDTAVGAFVQRRHVPDLERPLESRGRFAYHADRGLLWQVEEPVESVLVIDGTGVYQDGRRVGGTGGLAAVAPIFRGLFGGEPARLARHFRVTREDAASGWRLRLEPRDAGMAEAIASITITGDTDPDGLVIAAADGSRTEIVFADVAHPARLEPSVLRAFDRARPGR